MLRGPLWAWLAHGGHAEGTVLCAGLWRGRGGSRVWSWGDGQRGRAGERPQPPGGPGGQPHPVPVPAGPEGPEGRLSCAVSGEQLGSEGCIVVGKEPGHLRGWTLRLPPEVASEYVLPPGGRTGSFGSDFMNSCFCL